jgi:uncharacterized membrane protein
MKTFLGWTTAGVLLGIIAHISIVLMVPATIQQSVLDPLLVSVQKGTLHEIDPQNTPRKGLPDLDPYMLHATCGFSLFDGPVSFRVREPNVFWSLSVIGTEGTHRYSMNDRSIQRDEIELVLLTRPQLSDILEEQPESLSEAIVVTLDPMEGVFLFRVFVQDQTARGQIRDRVNQASCGAINRSPLDAFPGWESLML